MTWIELALLWFALFTAAVGVGLIVESALYHFLRVWRVRRCEKRLRAFDAQAMDPSYTMRGTVGTIHGR